MENPNSTSPDYTTIHNSILALGRGFDVTADIRLLYCKGAHGSRLIHIDEQHTKDLVIQEGFVIPNVPIDIEWTNGEKYRETSSVLDFSKMATAFNENSEILGNTPLGSFNSMFNFTGCQQIDVATVKALVMDGYFMPLYKVKLTKFPLFLKEDVKHAVPQTWDPLALAKFIENFGTHIITSATIGGQDVIYIKQHPSSLLSELDLLNYVKEIGNQRFLKSGNHLPNEIRRLEDVTVIFRRRGGNELIQSHHEWTETVPGTLDVISMTFFPIVNLLDGSPGLKHLSRAIDLYLEYKPPLEELQYFLDFQIPRVWSPVQDNFPGYQRKEPVCPSLQFSLMGPKLYISCEQVTVGRKPITGLRLCLEGSKQNRLVIHLQHLASLPKILQPRWDSHVAIGPPKWQGPEEQDSRWFEPIKWKKFSHVSTAPIEYTETCIGDLSGVHIVTGAQLGVWDISDKNILHLKLLFSKVPGCTIRRSVWDRNPSIVSQTQKTDRASTSLNEAKSDSSSQFAKIIKFVDLTEMSKGPQDMPGHWLVTGGKLGVEKGKIILRVKYSLLNY